MISKSKAVLAVKSLAVVAVVAGVATAGFDVKETKATLTAPSGKCGFSITNNMAGMNVRVSNWSDVGGSYLGTIDFDAGVINFKGVQIYNYGQTNAKSVASSGQRKFTLAAGDFPGNYIMTFDNEDKTKMNLISTNSGNTFLMQSIPVTNDDGPVSTGVCQAL